MLKTKKGNIAASAKKEVLKENEFKGFYVKLPAESYWRLQKHLNDLRISKLDWLMAVVREIE